MLNTETVIGQSDAAESARQESLTSPSKREEGRLCTIVEMYSIRLQLRPNTWIWDVQKRRTVTVAYVIGQHVRGSQPLQRCSWCAAIGQALLDLASYAVPPQGCGCQHMIGTTHAERAENTLFGTVHQVSLPVIFIHRTASSNDGSCSLKCVTDFRSYLERFGVSELAFTEIGDTTT